MLNKNFSQIYRSGNFSLPGMDIVRFTDFYRSPKTIGFDTAHLSTYTNHTHDNKSPYLADILLEEAEKGYLY